MHYNVMAKPCARPNIEIRRNEENAKEGQVHIACQTRRIGALIYIQFLAWIARNICAIITPA